MKPPVVAPLGGSTGLHRASALCCEVQRCPTAFSRFHAGARSCHDARSPHALTMAVLTSSILMVSMSHTTPVLAAKSAAEQFGVGWGEGAWPPM